jgi:CYTH domain-containing protein
VPVSLKYSVVERERRFLVSRLPDLATSTFHIVDRYLDGTRLRLREVQAPDGMLTRKLSHKVRLGAGPREVACTNVYLDDAEWMLLIALPARVLRKTRHIATADGWVVAIDEHEDGTLVAEIDDGDEPARDLPAWLDVVREVTDEESWTGAGLAR